MEIVLYVMAVIATATVCGLGFRIRGGLWNTQIERYVHWGSTTARLVAWALPVSVLGTIWFSLAWYWMPALLVATWLGCLLPWWGSLDMGRMEGVWLTDLLLHSLRGAAWCLPISLVFWLAGIVPVAWALLACGSAMGIWYEAGWQTRSQIPGFLQGSELGELYFGIMFGLTLAVMAIL